MRAKQINEGISNVLKGKTEAEFEMAKKEAFLDKTGISIEEAKALVEEFREMDIAIRLRYDNVTDSPFSMLPYKVLTYNRVIAETATEKGAEEIVKVF